MTIAAFTDARDRLLAAARSDLTSSEVCGEIARAVQAVAPYAAAAVMTTDPETHLPAGGVVAGFDSSACVPFWDNELLDPDFNKFNDLARSSEPVATLADVTDGDLARSPRFQKLYADYGTSDELRVAFTAGSSCVAIGAFLRCDGSTFTLAEVRDVTNLLVPAAAALRRALMHSDRSVGITGPVVLLVGVDGRIEARSEGADALLADLRVDDVDDELPGTILVAASKARTARTGQRLTTRLRGKSGRWVRIHIAPMADDATTVSVTIDAASPGDLVPILLDSYGLTAREAELVLALCRGMNTKELAAELSISVHTVRDHLKAVFDKAGVNSRGELVARLFSAHVLERFEAHVDAL